MQVDVEVLGGGCLDRLTRCGDGPGGRGRGQGGPLGGEMLGGQLRAARRGA